MPSAATLDVVALGHPLVDVLSHETDDVVARAGVERGAMTMVDAARSDEIYGQLGPAQETSGGSAANTAAGVASFGGRAAFIGRIADDSFGKVFAHDLRSAGVEFDVSPATDGSPTGRCLVIVAADAERTMCTYLGAGAEIDPRDVDGDRIASAAVTYLEGYLDEPPRRTWTAAASLARRRSRLRSRSWTRSASSATATSSARSWRTTSTCCLPTSTRSRCSTRPTTRRGRPRRRRRSEIARHVRPAARDRGRGERHAIDANRSSGVDTTGAGRPVRGGFLFGLTHGRDLETCGRLASPGGGEVIAPGARPEARSPTGPLRLA
jgi:sugar/nucleoside kinase (ribokinase family)